MSGKEQVDAYASLYKPDTLAGFKIGDAVRLPSIPGIFEVIGFDGESTLLLRSPAGKQVRAGWRVVSKVPTRTAPAT